MLRWVILAVAVVGLAAVATVAVRYTPDSTSAWKVPASVKKDGPLPKAEVEGELTHDFGPMPQKSTGKRKWKVKNAGQSDLEIWLAASSCSCTIASMGKDGRAYIKPGESTDVEVTWETRTFQDEYSRDVTIGTNDPDRPQFKLKVHGFVHPPVIRYPADDAIQLGTLHNDEPKRLYVALFSPDRKDLKLTKVTSSKPEVIAAHAEPMTPEDLKTFKLANGLKVEGGQRLVIDVKPGIPLGTLREEISVLTDHPQQPRIDVTLVGMVTGPISVVPSNLRLINVKSKAGASGDLTVLVRGGTPVNFTVARKPEKLQVEVLPSEDKGAKGRYRLHVTVPPGTPAGLVDEDIILKTDHPKVGELKIPISILVSSS